MSINLEICCASITSALAARDGSADRIELCDNLYEGGTTPSAGMIKTARELLDIGIHVMIRPRGGDFLYSDDEFRIMKEDVLMAKSLNADGVVFGILTPDGEIDTARCSELISLARPMKVIHHRAFDVTLDPFKSLETLISLGFDILLTSGQKESVPEGIDLIERLVRQANGAIRIMPGSGVNEKNILEIIEKTGVRDIHMTLRNEVRSSMQHTREDIHFSGAPPQSDYIQRIANPRRVRAVRALMATV